MPGSRRSLASDMKEMDSEAVQDSDVVRDSRSTSAMTDRPLPADMAAGPGLTPSKVKVIAESPANGTSASSSPAVKSEREELETVGGEMTVKLEPGKAPKLLRKMTQKVVSRPPPLFSHLDDATDEAKSTFEVLTDCSYASRTLGNTEQALECDCAEEWDSKTKTNHACGEDSDCINRATKMECPGDCTCGATCENQRFQQKLYSDVSVIKTDKKGFGLRANTDLKPNDFIFEYIGEVISEPAFRRRMHQYDQEGIKHFYFMSLTKSEFVDATKKGNLGRFCNHSCNPNCYVDKWVVGDKLRMGIFAERNIQAGEELVFNYNVDRYGADPQPCYCGEPNCSGFIGGKTQTDDDRATQLSTSVQHALGLYDKDDWEDAVAKPKRKKKVSEDDEEYVDSVEMKPLDMETCLALMSELYKNEEKWIIVKCLQRIQKSDDSRILNRVSTMHGYIIMNRVLTKWIDDVNVVLQVFDVIHKIPTFTKNKIQDAKIEETVEKLKNHDDERVRTQATELLEAWGKLEVAYRIPRVKRDRNQPPPEKRNERSDRRERERSRSRSRSRSKSVEAPKGPSGPRGKPPQRPFHAGPRPQFRPRQTHGALPPGWYEAIAQNGSTYFYNASGATTWQRPTLPALATPPPPPPKAVSETQSLQNLINSIVSKKNSTTTKAPSESTTPKDAPKREKKEEAWRSWPIEKQKRLYENTLFPTVNGVMRSYRDKLEKDDIKRFGKDIAKKLVESDFKNNRVADPTTIDPKNKKKMLQYIVTFFDKAVIKKRDTERRKSGKTHHQLGSTTPTGSPAVLAGSPLNVREDSNIDFSEKELEVSASPTLVEGTSVSPLILKRRHEDRETEGGAETDEVAIKKPRTVQAQAPPPPPPPPPPTVEETDIKTEPGHMLSEEYGVETANFAEYEQGPGFTIKGIAGPLSGADQYTTQVATPPTTGSPDGSEREKIRQDYTRMNPERMRRMDGA